MYFLICTKNSDHFPRRNHFFVRGKIHDSSYLFIAAVAIRCGNVVIVMLNSLTYAMTCIVMNQILSNLTNL